MGLENQKLIWPLGQIATPMGPSKASKPRANRPFSELRDQTEYPSEVKELRNGDVSGATQHSVCAIHRAALPRSPQNQPGGTELGSGRPGGF